MSIGIKSSESCRCGTFPVNGESPLFPRTKRSGRSYLIAFRYSSYVADAAGWFHIQQSEERNDRRIGADLIGNEPLTEQDFDLTLR